MTDKRTQEAAAADPRLGNMEKDPSDWVTGDEPMTGAQRSYLKTLSEEAHVDFDASLTKAQASRRIDELQAMTGRGHDIDSAAESLGKAVSAPILGAAGADPEAPAQDRGSLGPAGGGGTPA